jgi:tetratricopeptide (TPR) repeat protein
MKRLEEADQAAQALSEYTEEELGRRNYSTGINYTVLGQHYLARQRLPEAEEFLVKSAELMQYLRGESCSLMLRDLRLLFAIFQAQQKHTEAVKTGLKFLHGFRDKTLPRVAEMSLQLGALFLNLKDFKQAEEMALQATLVQPGQANIAEEAWKQLSVVYAASGRHSEAMQAGLKQVTLMEKRSVEKNKLG